MANVGDLATAGITATLSCDSQWISVTDQIGSWGPINAGSGSVSQADGFAISQYPDVPAVLADLDALIAQPIRRLRRDALQRFLDELAAKRPTPPDRCYVHNFSAPGRPRVLTLPAGRGARSHRRTSRCSR